MKKRLALAAGLFFSIISFPSFADHIEPNKEEIKEGDLVHVNQKLTYVKRTLRDPT